ncbi:MAG: endolytic transglycosylase MltG [Clostridium sp.]|nr:endolytic transglycosylase MltG [Acetatifactor muris]MCM1528151.1 endolytic transglycosylase MltG [Bacteroides sp.]MCM1562752.1 endolytic transglycosylase MltG [Clostridium sp.]
MKNGSLLAAVLGAILKVVVAVAAVFIIYRGAALCYDYGYRVFTEPAMTVGEGRKVQVTVTADMSPTDIGELMESKGLSRDGKLFALQYLLSEYRENVAPGTYELSTAMTAEEIMAAMVPAESEEQESASAQ